MPHKVARVCWNTGGWKFPTGSKGKSRDKDSYEDAKGFGAEEWLLDTSKEIDGYCYAFIQAVARWRDTYAGQTFDLSLYTIDGESKQRWWLGTIRNVSVVGAEESVRVYERYSDEGWLDQMRMQLFKVGADVDAFDNDVTPEIFAVIRFRIPDMEILNPPLSFDRGDPAVTSDYYNLKNFVQIPHFPVTQEPFVFRAGHRPQGLKGRVCYEAHDRQVNDLHVAVQNGLYEQLCQEFGADNVGTELDTSVGSRVDAVVRNGRQLTLYEIKIGPSLQGCVREAVGQLLEYRHAVGADDVTSLVIVSPHAPDERVDAYLAAMRSRHDLPFYYRQYRLPQASTVTAS